jgi:transketolase
VTLMATGSEVHLCVQAAAMLQEQGVGARVVSLPSWELFAEQPEAYRNKVLGGSHVIKLACEAACSMGWERWIGPEGIFIGMQSFGASAPAPELYRQFGITPEAMAEAVLERV